MGMNQENHVKLNRSMKSRHLFMLSLGGVIGTGLFLGSGYAIGEAGPAGAILAYLVGGLLMYLAMVCLGELSVVMPVSGSFQAHATKYIGPATGFVIGWVYWLSWAMYVGLEFVAAGVLMKRWFPDVPVWIWCALFIILLFSINSLATRSFAETEYWFAGIKVITVILFIIVGLGAVFGVLNMDGQPAPYFANFFGDGLFPTGLTGVFISMMTVIYAFQGSEIMGVAAGETEDPQKNIPKAIRNIVARILLFYVLAIFVLSAIVPWKEAGVLESPFVTVFDMVGIPYAADIMNFVILTAILSVGNTGLYACTRIMYSLSENGMAPSIFRKLNKRGVPSYALLITLGFALLSLLTSIVAEDTLFVVLLAVSGMGGTLTWMAIGLAQYRFRKQYIRDGGKLEDLQYRVRFFPLVPFLCIAMCLFIFIFMAFDPTQRASLFWGTGFIAACYLYYYLFYTRKKAALSNLTNTQTNPTVKEEN
ncbi:arginine:proton symporter (AAT family) [Thermolongibacillus altinsuensis]|uniref:Arginine:proton symporter (AAT family) n=1 Tax=Thermolongibacillus altinsuensis TaxID=575256 RepID=A0A4R1QFG9_9BACL|nr:amino acid permease [Thermolongibacillus altinsuensis]TCL47029.1 arginine:proton symporter (AAT family) [Thermolongibacillus altinsuensis]GMB09510.1 amino acid permease [Thermolongibacillus altinsuensis]